MGEAASRAIAAGLSLAAIADAEQIGQRRAREELGPEVLRRVERAARRKREAEHEYEAAIVRAGRLGLAHRDVAAAAQVAHGTVRAIIARACAAARHARRINNERDRGSLGSSWQTQLVWSMLRPSKCDPPGRSRDRAKRDEHRRWAVKSGSASADADRHAGRPGLAEAQDAG